MDSMSILLCYYTDHEADAAAKEIRLEQLCGETSYAVYLLDETHDCKPIQTAVTGTLTMTPNSVVLLKSV